MDTSLRPDISIAIRMAEDNKNPLDYYLLPSIAFSTEKVSLAVRNAVEFESFRFDNLDFFFGMAERYRMRRAA